MQVLSQNKHLNNKALKDIDMELVLMSEIVSIDVVGWRACFCDVSMTSAHLSSLAMFMPIALMRPFMAHT